MMNKWLGLFLLGLVVNTNAMAEIPSAKHSTQKPSLSKNTQFVGELKGYQTIEHRFRAKQGQRIEIQLVSKNRFVYFNLYAPKQSEALFTGVVSGDQFGSIAAKSGEYRIRVYLVRAAARRNETARYRLTINK